MVPGLEGTKGGWAMKILMECSCGARFEGECNSDDMQMGWTLVCEFVERVDAWRKLHDHIVARSTVGDMTAESVVK
jgi:hypothetical protein